MSLDELNTQHPDKFVPLGKILSHIRRGGRIFISTACGKPQFLVQSVVEHFVLIQGGGFH